MNYTVKGYRDLFIKHVGQLANQAAKRNEKSLFECSEKPIYFYWI